MVHSWFHSWCCNHTYTHIEFDNFNHIRKHTMIERTRQCKCGRVLLAGEEMCPACISVLDWKFKNFIKGVMTVIIIVGVLVFAGHLI